MATFDNGDGTFTVVWAWGGPYMSGTEGSSDYGAGGQRKIITHPSQLRHYGHPKPPMQPIADWATVLAEFEGLCNADQFERAIKHLIDNWCIAQTTDVPIGKLADFKAYVQRSLRSLPSCLAGTSADWRTDGLDTMLVSSVD